jgi:anti-sigma regulatory factor (Ser/Thr protein kinase)
MRSFPAIPQSVHAARRFAIDALSGSPASTIEAVELMVSELATNCIRHERASFHITILGTTKEIRIEVTDSGSGTPTMRSPGPDEPSGRGLQIVDMLSGTWGVEPEQPSGKTVWFTMPAASAAQAASEGLVSRRRIGESQPSFTGDPSTVQQPERTPNGPTNLHRRGFRRFRLHCGPRGAGVEGQGRLSGRRYCQHDESGRNARRRKHLGSPR